MRQLTLIPQGGGPGTYAIGDVYPNQKYPKVQSLPLYYSETDTAFAFGEPFFNPIINFRLAGRNKTA
ncbi:hypothetical protein [Treponema vincentii]|uniref:hypothetical protein n=1 Tax=Treponema vincentii TaxID=69710 RepID=UPI001E5BD968|nr:hypothetical protein [Treponema vincentii]